MPSGQSNSRKLCGITFWRQDFFSCSGVPLHPAPPLASAGSVDHAQAAADAEKLQRIPFPQTGDEGRDFTDGLLTEPLTLGYLRADVHLEAAQAQVFQPAGSRINRLDGVKGDAKFILVGAGRDLLVGMGLHIRVHSNGDGRDFFEAPRDTINPFQFGFTLRVETVDPLLEGKLDFTFCFTDAGKDAFIGIAALRPEPAATRRRLTISKPLPSRASALRTERLETFDLVAKQTRVVDRAHGTVEL